MKKLVSYLLVMAIMWCSFGQTVNATESLPIKEPSKTYEVYDGYGNLIGTANSLHEAQELISAPSIQGRSASIEPRSAYLVALAKIVYNLIVAVSVVYAVNQVMLGKADVSYIINQLIPLSTLQEIMNNNKQIYLYSVSAVVSNPYPPNSYQGISWIRSNFYYVVS